MKTYRLSEVSRAARWKPDGYYLDVLQRGEIMGRGRLVRLSDEDVAYLERHYRGLGDWVYLCLRPFVRIVDWLLHTNISRCGGCRRRRAWLNRLHSRISRLYRRH
jgi:hypothetical protein